MRITEGKELLELKENTFYGEIPELINSNIYFHGKNNILACEKGVTLKNSRIDFHFSNSIIYLSKNLVETMSKFKWISMFFACFC